MMQSEIETELRALRSELDAHAAGTKARDIEWRRLGLIAKASSILSSLTGLGFIITNLLRTSPNTNFHDQLVMMSIFFILLAVPLMIIGQALHRPARS
ncbi:MULTISPECIES: hypothetical protein [Bradyrhizobium]|uniref:hypothetical protein n=1 Tax=Bradyrhizobium TaxID=374 RepID=UPI00195B317F|nr:hypothetical protein [Bradyrhizobium canariense]MBM7486073.1 hypothetical protein [Bradyrhizobium canariense]UFW72905.1 hypothetical protein BcanWU425_03800 [Bradyrhizobium canariense]